MTPSDTQESWRTFQLEVAETIAQADRRLSRVGATDELRLARDRVSGYLEAGRDIAAGKPIAFYSDGRAMPRLDPVGWIDCTRRQLEALRVELQNDLVGGDPNAQAARSASLRDIT